jgi:anion transporter
MKEVSFMEASTITLIIMFVTMVSLVVEIIPMSMTALLCAVSLAVFKVLPAKQAFSFFGSTNIILFAAMFVIGYAFFETGMAKKAGTLITKHAKSERQLVIILMLVSGGLSMFLSNTGTTAVFIPLVMGLAASSGYSQSRLLYSMVAAVGMGGMGTLLAGPGWLYVKGTIEKVSPDTYFGVFGPSKVGIPMFIITVIYFGTVGYKLIPDRQGEVGTGATEEEKDVPAWKTYVACGVLIVTVLAMIFEKQIGVRLWLSAVIGAAFLVVSGTITEKQAFDSISWKTLTLFAGILPLSIALRETGAGGIIADTMLKMMGNSTNPYVITAVLMLIPTVMTNFISNATTAALMTPLGFSVAERIGADPVAIIMAISIGAGFAIATPIGQPGNAMIYGPSGLKFADYAKPAIPLTIIMYVVCIFLVPSVWPFFPG